MVLTVVAREVIRTGTKLLRSYYNVESKAFSKLYTGFPQSRSIGRGVRHGLTAGSVVGSLINNADDTPGNGSSIPFKKSRNPPRSSYKARGRQSAGYNRRRYRHKCPAYTKR